MSVQVSSLAELMGVKQVNDLKVNIVNQLFTFLVAINGKYSNIELEKLVNITKDVFPEFSDNISILLHKAQEHKETVEEDSGPTCQHKWNRDTEHHKKDSLCEAHKAEVSSDGKYYCPKHLKMYNNKHFCEFVLSDRCARKGEECGKMVKAKEALSDGRFNNDDYTGKWICSSHTTQINKFIENIENLCQFTLENDKQCLRVLAKDSNFCSKHTTKEKKPKEEPKKKTKEEDKKKPKKKLVEDSDEEDKKLKEDTDEEDNNENEEDQEDE